MRARDEASRTVLGLGSVFGTVGTKSQQLGGKLMGVGAAISGVGAGIAGVGAAGLAFFASATQGAMEYRQQAALTLTQVDKTKTSVKELEQIGIDIAKVIPVPLEQLQPALYDIFSSMNVGVKDAATLLRGFSKEAVAGQVDVQTAGRSTIAIMNAFKLPITDATHVMDLQFQLVRKGVGTYEEFASTIGRALPSTARAGQSVETLAGMLAFLTRNGLSAAMASTSAARALDALSNAKVAPRLAAMGIAVSDASGNFRPMLDVVGELTQKMSTMTQPERVAALQELFKGAGGTIQARRFFDLAIKNFGQLQGLVGDMSSENTTGAMKKAYDIMFKQPQSQAQLLTNHFKIFRQEIGEQLIPIGMKLLGVGEFLMGLWEGLNGKTKELVIWIGLGVAAFMLIMGVILLVGGAILVLAGLFALMSAPVVAAILIILAVLALLAVAAYEIVTHWDTVKDFFVDLWNDVYNYTKHIWNKIKGGINDALDSVRGLVEDVLNDLEKFWKENGKQILSDVEETWNNLKSSVTDIVTNLVNDVTTLFSWAVGIYKFIWDTWGSNIMDQVMNVWNFIVGIFNAALEIIKGIVKVVTGIIHGDFSQFMDGLVDIAKGIQDGVIAIFKFLFDTLLNWFDAFPAKILGALGALAGLLWNLFWDAVHGILDAVGNAIDSVRNWFINLPAAIAGWVSGLWDKLWTIGKDIVHNLWDGIKDSAGWLMDKITGFAGDIADKLTFGLLGSPWYFTRDVGRDLMTDMVKGLKDNEKMVYEHISNISANVQTAGAPTTLPQTVSNDQSINVNVQSNADPFEIGRELAWVQATNPWQTPSKAIT
jgi:TP901 family phage tail tape measure protein